jgi:hypothetical protein
VRYACRHAHELPYPDKPRPIRQAPGVSTSAMELASYRYPQNRISTLPQYVAQGEISFCTTRALCSLLLLGRTYANGHERVIAHVWTTWYKTPGIHRASRSSHEVRGIAQTGQEDARRPMASYAHILGHFNEKPERMEEGDNMIKVRRKTQQRGRESRGGWDSLS